MDQQQQNVDKQKPKKLSKEEMARIERFDELEDLRFILEMVQGRRLLWRLMGHANVFGSVWRQSAEIHYLAGRQDFGHFIMAEILEANGKAYVKMIEENQVKEAAKAKQN